MIEVVDKENKQDFIDAEDMRPLQIGIITHGLANYIGNYVMRTASKDVFELMDLTNAGENKCWGLPCSLKIRLLGEGESITIKLSNE